MDFPPPQILQEFFFPFPCFPDFVLLSLFSPLPKKKIVRNLFSSAFFEKNESTTWKRKIFLNEFIEIFYAIRKTKINKTLLSSSSSSFPVFYLAPRTHSLTHSRSLPRLLHRNRFSIMMTNKQTKGKKNKKKFFYF